MLDSEAKSRLALVVAIGVFVLAIVCIPFVGGGSLIRGMGNSGNRIYTHVVTDELAEAIAASPAVAPVSDDELRATYEAIRSRAGAGDLEAALVVFRVAQVQRGGSPP